MVALILATLLTADDVTWHEDAVGKYRIGLSGGIDDRATSAADRKTMLAGLDPWVAFFKKSLEPKGMDVLINKGAHGGSKVNDGPYYANVDVMLFKYKSSPRWGNKIIPEDETGLTMYVNVNGVHPVGNKLYPVGRTEKGGVMFLAPASKKRQGFTEYVVSPTERGLLLAPPGAELFVPVTRRELYAALRKEYAEHRRDTKKFEADVASVPDSELDAPAVAAPGQDWTGLQPKGAQPVVKYNPKFFKARGARTAPHFAMVHWKCSHLQPEDLPWMEALVDRIQWAELARLLVPTGS